MNNKVLSERSNTMLKLNKYGMNKISLTFISILLATSLLTAQDALADRKGKPQPGHDQRRFGPVLPPLPPLPPGIPRPPHFNPFPRLPSGHQNVRVGHDDYYYHHRGGTFYRRGPSGYFTVRAPFGAIVFNIPIGSRAVMSRGETYYVYDDVYYRRAGTRYIVVEPPRETVIVKEVSPVVPAEPNVGDKVLVTAPLLNIRSGPGMNFPVVREVDQGALLTIHGYAPDWLYVQLTGGEFGWAMVKFTTPLAPSANG
ncbi:MAG: SH3 domain-containing protein [Desulfobacteraceae bacterium]|nr:MAG: SH3 domain-containing protein [Desulfobacteraceae bacterium]